MEMQSWYNGGWFLILSELLILVSLLWGLSTSSSRGGAGIIQPSDRQTCQQTCDYETWDKQIFYLYNELIKN